MDKHRVKRILDRGQGVLRRDQHRMNLYLNAVPIVPRHAQKLDLIAELMGIADILRGNLRDSLGVNLGEGHTGVKRQAGHNRDLSARVVAFHIRGGIRLGITQLRGLGQRLLVIHAFVGHFAQNIIGGAVDNSHDLGQMIARQGLL